MLALLIIALAVAASFGLGVLVGRRAPRPRQVAPFALGHPPPWADLTGGRVIRMGDSFDYESPRARAKRFAKESS